MAFGVHSEVGKLRQVMVHRPGLEHARLTPSNAEELLFDDVLWVSKGSPLPCLNRMSSIAGCSRS